MPGNVPLFETTIFWPATSLRSVTMFHATNPIPWCTCLINILRSKYHKESEHFYPCVPNTLKAVSPLKSCIALEKLYRP
jgi:hypothetical protein